MSFYVDPACPTCHGKGYYYTDEGETPCAGCRLTERHATRYCDACHRERPVTGMTFAKGEFGNEYATCAECGEADKVAHEAAVEAAYRDAYAGLSPLEQRFADGDR